jgi:hypothetical protein
MHEIFLAIVTDDFSVTAFMVVVDTFSVHVFLLEELEPGGAVKAFPPGLYRVDFDEHANLGC